MIRCLPPLPRPDPVLTLSVQGAQGWAPRTSRVAVPSPAAGTVRGGGSKAAAPPGVLGAGRAPVRGVPQTALSLRDSRDSACHPAGSHGSGRESARARPEQRFGMSGCRVSRTLGLESAQVWAQGAPQPPGNTRLGPVHCPRAPHASRVSAPSGWGRGSGWPGRSGLSRATAPTRPGVPGMAGSGPGLHGGVRVFRGSPAAPLMGPGLTQLQPAPPSALCPGGRVRDSGRFKLGPLSPPPPPLVGPLPGHGLRPSEGRACVGRRSQRRTGLPRGRGELTWPRGRGPIPEGRLPSRWGEGGRSHLTVPPGVTGS